MQEEQARRAVTAAIAVVESFDLDVDETTVLNDSNRLVVRLLPCDVVARIVPVGYRVFASAIGAEREVQLLRRLGSVEGPIAVLEPRVPPHVFVRDGFEVELLTCYVPVTTRRLPAGEYAHALSGLHVAMRQIDLVAPHFTDRVADVEAWVARRDETPDLDDDDRARLLQTLGGLRQSVLDRRAPEQLLHGEPHPWNVLDTTTGPRFVDFENCVLGPVEWDLGWVPTAVGERYPGADRDLVVDCRGLVLALVAAHCWRPADERPGEGSRAAFMDAVRAGPPWTALDDV
jgi:aminoglycoside phosphotransferase (APT) family kinase protein